MAALDGVAEVGQHRLRRADAPRSRTTCLAVWQVHGPIVRAVRAYCQAGTARGGVGHTPAPEDNAPIPLGATVPSDAGATAILRRVNHPPY
ncbi:hypothetical protein GCM10010243_20720 [Streptomyces matensis]|nr:hypothetical protein GCM10010243_20720 [Streptomyces matensis]